MGLQHLGHQALAVAVHHQVLQVAHRVVVLALPQAHHQVLLGAGVFLITAFALMIVSVVIAYVT